LLRCISHDNTGSNSDGFFIRSPATLIGCISDSNGRKGFGVSLADTAGSSIFLNCDAYNNASDGVDLSATTAGDLFIFENCNFIKNGGYGINGSGSGGRYGVVRKCGFGAGTQANTSGQTNGLKSMVVVDPVTYTANMTPWVDPANGDFRINLTEAIGEGAGDFTQEQDSYDGAVGYPSIGACQPSSDVSSAETSNVWIS
jgi:hypothetical protein